MSLVLFPEASRLPGRYESLPFTADPDVRAVRFTLSGSDAWVRLGVYQPVIRMALEENRAGTWRLVTGSDIPSGPIMADGVSTTSTSLVFPVDGVQVPQTQYRMVLVCQSVCLSEGVLEYIREA